MLMSYVLDGGQFEHTIEKHDPTLVRARAAAAEGADRHRQEPDRLCRGRARSRPRLCRRARRRVAAASRAPEGAAGARQDDRVLRDDRAAAGAGRRRDGGGRDQGRPRGACRIVARFRPPHRRSRAGDLPRRRQPVQHRLDQAIGRRAVRKARAARRQEGQDRRLRHRRLDPRRAGAAARRRRGTCSNGAS